MTDDQRQQLCDVMEDIGFAKGVVMGFKMGFQSSANYMDSLVAAQDAIARLESAAEKIKELVK